MSRQDAAAESLRIVERNRGTLPPDQSLCLPATDTDPESLRRFGYAVLFRLIAGIGGIAAGAVIALAQRGSDPSGGLIVGLCCSVGGILLLLSNPFFQRRFVRRQIWMRYDELVSSGSYSSPLCVTIEDADTFHKFKLFPEDLGYLALDPSRNLVVIEGIRFRYLIFGKDVREVAQASGAATTATAIEYVVGKVTVRIALQYDNVWHEFKRQTIGVRGDALITRIRATLHNDEMLAD